MIVYVNASFLNITPMTGLSRFALTMSYNLKRKMGDNVRFLLPKGDVIYPEIVKDLGAIQIGLNRKRTRWEQIDLPLFLLKNKNPLLISFGNSAPLYYRNQLISVLDLFYHNIDNVLTEKQKAYPWIEVQYYKFIIPRILKSAKTILTISEYSKKDIEKKFNISSSKIEVVYPSIPESFEKAQKSRVEEINRYGKYILGVSSVNPRKNFEGVIKAYKKADLPGVKLVIVGDINRQDDKHSLYNEFEKDPNIIFTGYVTDSQLKSLYANALFFAYPSFFEGFGIPPLEAMSCGCPTLVSSVTSLPEVCGDASLYVNPYDVDDIAHGMETLFCNMDLRSRLIEKGYERLVKFDAEKSIAKLLSIIEKMITLG